MKETNQEVEQQGDCSMRYEGDETLKWDERLSFARDLKTLR